MRRRRRWVLALPAVSIASTITVAFVPGARSGAWGIVFLVTSATCVVLLHLTARRLRPRTDRPAAKKSY